MTDREALTQLIQAVNGYFATKGSEDDKAWIVAFNALLIALAHAKQQIQHDDDDQARGHVGGSMTRETPRPPFR